MKLTPNNETIDETEEPNPHVRNNNDDKVVAMLSKKRENLNNPR